MDHERKAKQRAFSRAVLRRDGARCMICSFDKVLEAAHIIPIRKSENGQEAIHKCGLSSLYDVRNGVTLCKYCHLNFDQGWISMDENYRVCISDLLLASHPEYRRFQGKDMGWQEGGPKTPLQSILRFQGEKQKRRESQYHGQIGFPLLHGEPASDLGSSKTTVPAHSMKRGVKRTRALKGDMAEGASSREKYETKAEGTPSEPPGMRKETQQKRRFAKVKAKRRPPVKAMARRRHKNESKECEAKQSSVLEGSAEKTPEQNTAASGEEKDLLPLRKKMNLQQSRCFQETRVTRVDEPARGEGDSILASETEGEEGEERAYDKAMRLATQGGKYNSKDRDEKAVILGRRKVLSARNLNVVYRPFPEKRKDRGLRLRLRWITKEPNSRAASVSFSASYPRAEEILQYWYGRLQNQKRYQDRKIQKWYEEKNNRELTLK